MWDMDRFTTPRRGAPTGRWEPIGLAGFVAAPVLAVAAAVGWALSVRGELPDRIAVHFGAGGEADGFGGLAGILAVLVVVPLPMVLFFGLFGSWRRHPRIMRRSLGPGAPVFAGFMAGIVPDTLAPQLGLASAEGTVIGSAWMIIGTFAGLVVGAVTARLIPPAPASTADSAPDPSLPRGPRGEPVRTVTSTGMKIFVVVWLVGAVTSLLLSTALFLILLLSTFYLAQTYVVRLRVDDDAVRFRALLGETIPLDTITAARPATYDWGDSGGVGIRTVSFPGTRGKRVAVASRSGEALDIDTTGTSWTFVVPDGTAEALAGDINARLDRLHG